MAQGKQQAARGRASGFLFPRALEITQDELIERITHLAFYVGWPSAMSAVTKAKELFGKKAV